MTSRHIAAAAFAALFALAGCEPSTMPAGDAGTDALACAPACPSGIAACCPTASGVACATILTDRMNCGGCGIECAGTCSAGTCAP